MEGEKKRKRGEIFKCKVRDKCLPGRLEDRTIEVIQPYSCQKPKWSGNKTNGICYTHFMKDIKNVRNCDIEGEVFTTHCTVLIANANW